MKIKSFFMTCVFFRGLVPQADAPYDRALGFPCCLYRKFMLFSPTIQPLYLLLTAENPVFSDYLQMAGEIVAVFASFCLKQPSFSGRYFLLSAFLFLSSPWYFSLSYKIFFITKFVTHVRKFVIKNLLYDSKNNQAGRENFLADGKMFELDNNCLKGIKRPSREADKKNRVRNRCAPDLSW